MERATAYTLQCDKLVQGDNIWCATTKSCAFTDTTPQPCISATIVDISVCSTAAYSATTDDNVNESVHQYLQQLQQQTHWHSTVNKVTWMKRRENNRPSLSTVMFSMMSHRRWIVSVTCFSQTPWQLHTTTHSNHTRHCTVLLKTQHYTLHSQVSILCSQLLLKLTN